MANVRPDKCEGECLSCPMASEEGLGAWVAAHDQASGGGLAGARLLGRAATAFILPLAGALLGAMLAGGGESRRFVGMLAGLAIATAAGVVVGRVVRGRVSPDEGPAEPTKESS